MFEYRRSFEDGLLEHIGRLGGTAPYSNPHILSLVVATRSSNASGRAVDFVGREKKVSYTDNSPQSWMAVDIGATRRLQINHYCLRHGRSSYDNCCVLRHWELQGSNDGLNWTVLRQHSNDTSMGTTAYCEGHWAVNSPASNTPYRHFRILQTGKNSGYSYGNPNDYLMCCGIELYGKLTISSGDF